MKIFDKIQLKKPRRSVFDLSHERKFTMNMGDLVPILCQEVIPGDTFRMNLEQLVRFQPMLAPMMHRVNVYTHFFFVPNRIIWNEFEDFITGGEDGTAKPLFPTFMRSTTDRTAHQLRLTRGSLSDYLGYPVANIPQDDNISMLQISQLPYRAYHTIWNEYYRDQNLEDPVNVPKSSGNITPSSQNPNQTTWQERALTIQKRAWEKDYFTSALPFAQKGQQLSIPVSGKAPIEAEGAPVYVGQGLQNGDCGLDGVGLTTGDQLEADLANASSASINDLRKAFSIQRWLEKNARGGSRYIEQLLVHFGVKSSDARLQRPEYLGGGKTPVTISEVLQNSATESTSPQGTMAGHGVSAGASHSFKKYFEEHGYVIGIMSVLPRTAYYQGLPKTFTKFDKFDYYWPDFAHLGEQEVKQGELYYDPSSNENNNKTFGYQPRYTEYRYVMDTVHGDFTGNLDYWHLGRKFTNEPALNADFVKANPDHRIFAVEDPNAQKLLVNTYCNLQAIRPIPKYGNPGGI